MDDVEACGRRVFGLSEAAQRLGGGRRSLAAAAHRLTAAGRVIKLGSGYFGVVPVRDRRHGVPASAIVDEMQRLRGEAYYAGLFTAARLHGGPDLAPGEFQVLVGGRLRPLRLESETIRFVMKSRGLATTPTARIAVGEATILVSTPEATAFDVLRYCGPGAATKTALAALSRKITARQLVYAAGKMNPDLSYAQRLGYLLDAAGFEKCAASLADWLRERHPRPALLLPGGPPPWRRSFKWNVLING